MIKKCFGCLAEFEKTTDEIVPHPYIGAIPECWEVYGELLAKEYGDLAYGKVHRVTVDAYAAQHIGDQGDRRARQSGNVHLIALFLTFDQNATQSQVLEFIKKATATKRDWPPLIQRENPGWLTVQDIGKTKDPESHTALVQKWGESTWKAYSDCREGIIDRYKQVIRK